MNKLSTTFCNGIFLLSALSLASCGEEMADEHITESMVSHAGLNTSAQAASGKVQEIFYAVPSPMEMATLLKKEGAEYNVDLLNDVKRVNGYTSAQSRALNLGIYGADLSYASVFNQNQESIIYLSCAKKLADNLGVTKAFNDETIERMEENVDNRDSLLNIVSETYYMLDAYLKENGRDHVSALVITAGWVEGLYLSTSIALQQKNPTEALLQRIADQKISLVNLIELVDAYNKDNQIDEIVADLQRIDAAFAAVEHQKKESANLSTGSDGVAVIGSASKTTLTAENLIEIGKVITEIRTKYIS